MASRILPPLPAAPTHADIVRHFVRYKKKKLLEELEWFAGQQTFRAALSEAAYARGRDGKRLSHQRRLLKHVIPESHAIWSAHAPALQRCSEFDDLIALIEQLLGNVERAGDLYFYDTALRLGILPNRVFLQTGAWDGARRVVPGIRGRSVPLSAFPEPYHALAPYEMENALCVYKSAIPVPV
ncbi:hypothetical protein JJB11_21475 [Ramlibacter ginsenosidimutans]|uniref:Uncharacterized protein n=1 Tax=Ramlibacter ginsenosidimutans TaxID=502333 RepID=A0A934TXF7_9BURK|nr:hypothetical protein [Ramlibacter ginsenosidimutans]MBK6008680.1 hypothetical protein [Ramlibacter ginsenosidimutans]